MRGIARLQVPERVIGSLGDVLRGDAHRQWANWFLGAICDVDQYARAGTDYAHIFADILNHIRDRMTELSVLEAKELASQVAKIAHNEARRRAANIARMPISRALRHQLIDVADGKPYCWVCGWRFQPESIDTFLGLAAEQPKLPGLIDIFKPIGLNIRHLRIEVDHVTPFSRGGADCAENLRLSCGWCNAHKSDRSSIYEVSGEARVTTGTTLTRALPQPFWIVRVLAIEAQRGVLSPKDCELTVALRNPNGSVNPSNLMVVRYEDDPMGTARFQNRDIVSRMWRQTPPAM